MITYSQSTILLIALIIATICDVKKKLIPNLLTFPLILISLIFSFCYRTSDLVVDLIAVVALFLVGTLNIMGFGDIKLLMGITLLCGWKIAIRGIIIALILLLLYDIIKRLLKGENPLLTLVRLVKSATGDNTKYAFAPFLSIGVSVSFVYMLFI